MPNKQVNDFDNPDQGDKDEYGLKSISDHGHQEQLSPKGIVMYGRPLKLGF